jgi:hypothetical protein
LNWTEHFQKQLVHRLPQNLNIFHFIVNVDSIVCWTVITEINHLPLGLFDSLLHHSLSLTLYHFIQMILLMNPRVLLRLHFMKLNRHLFLLSDNICLDIDDRFLYYLEAIFNYLNQINEEPFFQEIQVYFHCRILFLHFFIIFYEVLWVRNELWNFINSKTYRLEVNLNYLELCCKTIFWNLLNFRWKEMFDPYSLRVLHQK